MRKGFVLGVMLALASTTPSLQAEESLPLPLARQAPDTVGVERLTARLDGLKIEQALLLATHGISYADFVGGSADQKVAAIEALNRLGAEVIRKFYALEEEKLRTKETLQREIAAAINNVQKQFLEILPEPEESLPALVPSPAANPTNDPFQQLLDKVKEHSARPVTPSGKAQTAEPENFRTLLKDIEDEASQDSTRKR